MELTKSDKLELEAILSVPNLDKQVKRKYRTQYLIGKTKCKDNDAMIALMEYYKIPLRESVNFIKKQEHERPYLFLQ